MSGAFFSSGYYLKKNNHFLLETNLNLGYGDLVFENHFGDKGSSGCLIYSLELNMSFYFSSFYFLAGTGFRSLSPFDLEIGNDKIDSSDMGTDAFMSLGVGYTF